jgi:hypothetical protein
MRGDFRNDNPDVLHEWVERGLGNALDVSKAGFLSASDSVVAGPIP